MLSNDTSKTPKRQKIRVKQRLVRIYSLNNFYSSVETLVAVTLGTISERAHACFLTF